MLIQGPCDPRRHYFLLMFLTSNLESMAYKPFCTGVLSTQRSCARCKAGAALLRQANFVRWNELCFGEARQGHSKFDTPQFAHFS